MSRRVPSRGSRAGRWRTLVGVLVVAVAATGVAVPAASFTTADVPRTSGVDVVDDANGLVGLDKATTVRRNSRERLVTITNNAAEPASVTVSLAASSADGELYCGSGDCTKQGPETVVLTLSPGGSAGVDVEATGSPTGRIVYDVTGEAGALRVELQRSAAITPESGGGSPGGGSGSGSGNGGN